MKMDLFLWILLVEDWLVAGLSVGYLTGERRLLVLAPFLPCFGHCLVSHPLAGCQQSLQSFWRELDLLCSPAWVIMGQAVAGGTAIKQLFTSDSQPSEDDGDHGFFRLSLQPESQHLPQWGSCLTLVRLLCKTYPQKIFLCQIRRLHCRTWKWSSGKMSQ